MTTEQQFLLQLVRAGIDGATDFVMPEGIDWDALYQEATKQNVSVIACDGLQKLFDSGVYTDLGDKELRRRKTYWFSKTILYEQRFAERLEAAKVLGEWLAAEGIQTVVLKGYTVSECYPIPAHRYSADMDCYLLRGGEHMEAYEAGNQVVEKHGIAVNRGFYKNSAFSVGDLKVENHKFCTPFRGNATLRRFERLLQGMIADGPMSTLADTGLYAPPALASALFLTEHVYAHFLHEGLQLRHFLDWLLFRRKHADDIDWKAFDGYVDEFGFRRFFDAFEHVGQFILGSRTSLNESELRMLDSVWAGLDKHDSVRGVAGKLRLAGNTLRAAWKYRLFAPISMPRALWIQVKGFVFERRPKI